MSENCSTEKICGNCTHLFISGMFKSWGGKVGYCRLIQFNKNTERLNEQGQQSAKTEAIMGIMETCDKFKEK